MKKILEIKENSKKINSPNDLFKNIKKIKVDYEQENFLVFFLRTDNSLIDTEIIFKGGLNSCVIDPKTIFRKALLHNSAKIIVAHNHPSGSLKPSDEDIEIYKRLEVAGDTINLSVLDSIIFNKKGEYLSLNDL